MTLQSDRLEILRSWNRTLLKELSFAAGIISTLQKHGPEWGYPLDCVPAPGYLDIENPESGLNRLIDRAVRTGVITAEEAAECRDPELLR